MSVVRLADAIIPEVYTSYSGVDSPELTAFYQSGIVVRNAQLDQLANNGGKTINMPFWKDIDQTVEPNYSTDDPAVAAAPGKITADKMIGRTAQMNKGMSAADLVSELAGSNPMQHIRDRFSTYWTRQWQRRLLAAAVGVFAENLATGSAGTAGDMINDIAIADGDAATDDNLFSRKAFTRAVFTLGDAFSAIQAIAVHSVVYNRMVDNDDIVFIKDSVGNLTVPTFLGIRVVVDDQMPVVAGATSGYKFTSILFGTGAFGYGEGSPLVPVEVWRNPQGANGGGVEELWERKTWLIHPLGYKWNEASVAGESATLAELKTASNYTRVVERKLVPLAFLRTNG
jgi:hypothetical protein